MPTLVLAHREVTELLDMAGLVPLMRRTLVELSRGEIAMPPRQMLPHPDQPGLIAWMPAVLRGGDPFGSKVISVYPENRQRGMHTHQGVVVLFRPKTGEVRAIVDADAVTARRTAAVSAAATDLLAQPDAADLGLIGSGTLAETHLEAMLGVRPIRRVRVYARRPDRLRDFAERMSVLFEVEVQPAADAQTAVVDADIVCTLTDARSPVLEGAWLHPGAHVNAVGASVGGFRELDDETVRRSLVFVDSLLHALPQADDLRLPIEAGVVGPEHVRGEIGAVADGRLQGRRQPDDVTLFKSVGLAAEDMAAAAYCVERAEALGLGTWIELGAGR